MHIDIAIGQLKGLLHYLKTYRENGFVYALSSSKELAIEMKIEPTFREKRIIRREKII